MKNFFAAYTGNQVEMIKAYSLTEAKAKAASTVKDANGKTHYLWDVYEV